MMYKIKLRKFGETISFVEYSPDAEHDHDPRIRPHGYTTEEMMQPPSGTVPPLSRCCCPGTAAAVV